MNISKLFKNIFQFPTDTLDQAKLSSNTDHCVVIQIKI
jgi:hypothetical protein